MQNKFFKASLGSTNLNLNNIPTALESLLLIVLRWFLKFSFEPMTTPTYFAVSRYFYWTIIYR